MDCTPYQIDPAEGLPLSGPTTFGRYVSDDGDVARPRARPRPGASRLRRRRLRRASRETLPQARHRVLSVLDGHGVGEPLRHSALPREDVRGVLPRRFGFRGGSIARRLAAQMHLEVGRPVAVVATMGACGRMRLYVDGMLIAEGVGLGGVRRFSPQHIGRRRAVPSGGGSGRTSPSRRRRVDDVRDFRRRSRRGLGGAPLGPDAKTETARVRRSAQAAAPGRKGAPVERIRGTAAGSVGAKRFPLAGRRAHRQLRLDQGVRTPRGERGRFGPRRGEHQQTLPL